MYPIRLARLTLRGKKIMALDQCANRSKPEEELSFSRITPTQCSFTVSRNPSSKSLRSIAGPGCMAPPRVPLTEPGNGSCVPPLSVSTKIAPGTASRGDFAGSSYFSPINDSPTSTRSISQQSFSQFARHQTACSHWPHEENKHRTAPAIGRAPFREGPAPPNSFVVNGRTVTRTSLLGPDVPRQEVLAENYKKIYTANSIMSVPEEAHRASFGLT